MIEENPPLLKGIKRSYKWRWFSCDLSKQYCYELWVAECIVCCAIFISYDTGTATRQIFNINLQPLVADIMEETNHSERHLASSHTLITVNSGGVLFYTHIPHYLHQICDLNMGQDDQWGACVCSVCDFPIGGFRVSVGQVLWCFGLQ